MEIGSAHDLGAVLRTARTAKGWTQQQVADVLGTTRQWVASVEDGAPTARLGQAIEALRCVDVRLDSRADESQTTLDAVFGVRL